jgi:hypothetical protein
MTAIEDLKELFDAKLDALQAINERQSEDIAEIKAAITDFRAGCNLRHEHLNLEMTDLKTKQAYSNGVSREKSDFTSIAYLKLMAVFTAIYAAISFAQWLMRGFK